MQPQLEKAQVETEQTMEQIKVDTGESALIVLCPACRQEFHLIPGPWNLVAWS